MSATKQSKAKKTASSKKPLSHPPFAEMITDAIVSLKERTGSSQYAITKFIEGKHHKELPQTFRKLILHQLKKAVAAGKLVKVKNSFKLAPTRPAPAKTTTAAPAATKKPKAAASKPATKKPAASSKPKPKAAAKPSTAAKPKPKAKPAKAPAGKKVAAAKPARKTPVKSVKKPKSVKSPAKKAKK